MTIPDPTQIADASFQAASETLESMGFIELRLDLPPITEPEDEDYVWGKIPLLRPLQGSCMLACPSSLAQEIACALYSFSPEEVSPGILLDTLGEIANTVTGNCLSRLVPPSETFAIGLPETGTGCPERGQGQLLRFLTDDDRPVLVRVLLSE